MKFRAGKETRRFWSQPSIGPETILDWKAETSGLEADYLLQRGSGIVTALIAAEIQKSLLNTGHRRAKTMGRANDRVLNFFRLSSNFVVQSLQSNID